MCNEVPIENTAPVTSVPLQITPVTQIRHTSWWLIIVWLLTFPPIAWYLMYKDKQYHKWFAYLLWMSSAVPLVTVIPESIFAIPQLSSLYKTLNTPYSTGNFYIGVIILVLISIAEIIIGIILFIKLKEPFDKYKKLLFMAMGLFIANGMSMVIAVILSFASIILPIYNITNSIK